MKIINEKSISMGEARIIMEKQEKNRELNYEQKLALEHLKKFTKLKDKEAEKLIEELGCIVKMLPDTAVQLINILPKTADELRLIFSREKFSLKEDEIKKILDVLSKYK